MTINKSLQARNRLAYYLQQGSQVMRITVRK
jgi:hypothetical protein